MIANDDCQLEHLQRPSRQTYCPCVEHDEDRHIFWEKLVYVPEVMLFMRWCAQVCLRMCVWAPCQSKEKTRISRAALERVLCI